MFGSWTKPGETVWIVRHYWHMVDILGVFDTEQKAKLFIAKQRNPENYIVQSFDVE